MLGELRVIQRAAQQTDRRELVIYGLSGSLSAVIAGAGVCWAAFATVRGTLTVGDFTLLVATLMSIFGALSMIMSSAGMAYQGVLTFRSTWRSCRQALTWPNRWHPDPLGRYGGELNSTMFGFVTARTSHGFCAA